MSRKGSGLRRGWGGGAAALILALPPLLAGCGDRGEPALTVGGELRFTEADLAGLSRERRQDLGVVAGFGLAVARGEVGRLGEPRVVRLEGEFLVERLVDEETLRRAGVGDDVLRARYETSPAWQLEVRHILFRAERNAPDSVRAAARARALEALTRAQEGEDFATLAAQLSEEPGAAQRGGLLRPGRRGDWVPEFWGAASVLQPGGLSGVVETVYGFHVLRLEGREPVPFAEMRGEVVREVAGLLGRPEREAARSALETELSEGIEVLAGSAAALRGAAPSPSDPVARWPGGTLRTDAFLRWWAALEAREAPDLEAAPPGEVEEAIRRAALDARLVERALAREIHLPAAEGDALRRSWEAQAARWAAALGFRTGLAPEAVGTVALRALGATGQDQAIARDELLRAAPLVRALYPIRLTPPG